MTDIKPRVVYFCNEQEMVDVVTSTLCDQFEVTAFTEVTRLDEALDILGQIKPDYVIIDPKLSSLDHQQLHHRIKTDAALKGTQILIVREDA